MKACSKCKIEKELTEFYRKKTGRDGLTASCKECIKSKSRKYHHQNRDSVLERQHERYHRDIVETRRKANVYWAKNRDKKKAKDKRYYESHEKERLEYLHSKEVIDRRHKCCSTDEYKKKQNEYRRNSPVHQKRTKAYMKKYSSNPERKRIRNEKRKWRRKNDPQYILAELSRSRMNGVFKLKGIKKDQRTHEIMGCSYAFLEKHIESQFAYGMTWENRGRGGWEIDHIKPINSFNLFDEKQKAECFNWKNLQPLWWKDNANKKAKLDWVKPEHYNKF